MAKKKKQKVRTLTDKQYSVSPMSPKEEPPTMHTDKDATRRPLR